MTTPSTEHPFSFESVVRFERPARSRGQTAVELGGSEETIFVVVGLVLSGSLLFWKYTIALGAVMLAVTTFRLGHARAQPRQSETIREARAAGRTTPRRCDGEGLLAARHRPFRRSIVGWGHSTRSR